MKKFLSWVFSFLGAIFFFVDLYISICVFPSNLVLDLFCPAVSQAQLDQLENDYGQMAGYPAGEGIPVVNTIEEYEKIGMYKRIEGSEELGGKEYFTFETDSIIPLDYYRLKSGVSNAVASRRRSGVTTRYRNNFDTSPYATDRSYYNRCYLVALPDGNYVLAWLEDAYYWKYKLTGKVQLPLGCKTFMTGEGKALASYIQEYGLDEDKILLMFSDERYEQQKTLYFLVQLGVLVSSLAIVIALVWLVQTIAHKVTGN